MRSSADARLITKDFIFTSRAVRAGANCVCGARTPVKNIRLYRWTHSQFRVGNFGDDLSVPILQQLFSVEPVEVTMRDAEMVCVGSVLDSFSSRGRRKRFVDQVIGRSRLLHVWGSGALMAESSLSWGKTMRYHAVRGALTAARIPGFKGALGDPGILSSLLLDTRPAIECSVALIPNYKDMAVVSQLELPRGWKLIDPDGECLSVIKSIATAELVVSSSLHGLIVADSFGIPAVWATTTNPLAFGSADYKYQDHASARRASFNRPQTYDQIFSSSINTLGDLSSRAGRSISDWQADLIRSFPDL